MADFRLLIGTQLVEPGANPITDLLVVKVLVDRCVFQGPPRKGLSKDSQFVFGEFEQAAEGLAFAGAEVRLTRAIEVELFLTLRRLSSTRETCSSIP